MASVSNPNRPLSQSMTRTRRPILLPLLGGILGLAMLGLAAIGFLEGQRSERIVVLARDVAYAQPLTSEDLRVIEVPRVRDVTLTGLSTPELAVGQYAARELRSGDVLQPATMLMAEIPLQPVYPNGEELAANMVPVAFSLASVGPLSHRDRLNVGFNDMGANGEACRNAQAAVGEAANPLPLDGLAATEPNPFACRLLSAVEVLYVEGEVAYLELTPYQALALRSLQAAGVALWGERYGLASDDLAPLDRLEIDGIAPDPLTAPAPAPSLLGSDAAPLGAPTAAPSIAPTAASQP